MAAGTQTVRRREGFTIVELLIVIVVIGVLTTIAIVAYDGIQGRALDSAVQSDIGAYAKKIELFNVDNGRYPNTVADLNSLTVTLSNSAYSNHANAVMYCIHGTNWAIAGASKSGLNGYYFNNAEGSVKRRAWWAAGNSCNDFNVQHSVSGDWAAYRTAPASWSANHLIP